MRNSFRTLAALLIVALTPGIALAQGGAADRRPYRGLFGGGATSPDQGHSLVLSGSLFGAYDDNLGAALTDGAQEDWRLHHSGPYWGANGGVNYAFFRRQGQASYGVHGGANVTYYRHEDISTTSPNYYGGASFGFPLGRSRMLSGGYQLSYSSYHRFLLFPVVNAPGQDVVVDNGAVAADPDVELFSDPAVRQTANVSFSQRIGRYSSLGLGYGFTTLNFLEDEGLEDESEVRLRDYTTHSGIFRFDYQRPVTAHTNLNLGYGLRVSDSQRGSGEPRVLHDIRAGLGYSRALSFSRRTSISFSGGSGIGVSEDLTDPDGDPRTTVRLTGNAALIHELGRTWTARVAYFRGFVFREGFDDPYFTDSVSAGVDGLITRRLSFSARGAWALSELQRSSGGGHQAFTGSANSTYALNEFLALFAHYFYYKYDFDPEVPLDPRFPPAVDRQGVRVGVTASLPLLGR